MSAPAVTDNSVRHITPTIPMPDVSNEVTVEAVDTPDAMEEDITDSRTSSVGRKRQRIDGSTLEESTNPPAELSEGEVTPKRPRLSGLYEGSYSPAPAHTNAELSESKLPKMSLSPAPENSSPEGQGSISSFGTALPKASTENISPRAQDKASESLQQAVLEAQDGDNFAGGDDFVAFDSHSVESVSHSGDSDVESDPEGDAKIAVPQLSSTQDNHNMKANDLLERYQAIHDNVDAGFTTRSWDMVQKLTEDAYVMIETAIPKDPRKNKPMQMSNFRNKFYTYVGEHLSPGLEAIWPGKAAKSTKAKRSSGYSAILIYDTRESADDAIGVMKQIPFVRGEHSALIETNKPVNSRIRNGNPAKPKYDIVLRQVWERPKENDRLSICAGIAKAVQNAVERGDIGDDEQKEFVRRNGLNISKKKRKQLEANAPAESEKLAQESRDMEQAACRQLEPIPSGEDGMVHDGEAVTSSEVFKSLPPPPYNGPSDDTRPVQLHALATRERALQTRYFGITKNTDEVLCLCCSKPGHTMLTCPARTCTHCGAVDEHFEHACHTQQKCKRCREKGHGADSCLSKLAHSAAADGFFCDTCQRMGHAEEHCTFVWRTFNPDEVSELKKVGGLRSACYVCAKKGHWGDDCPLRSVKDRLAIAASGRDYFSQREANKFLIKPKNLPSAEYDDVVTQSNSVGNRYDDYAETVPRSRKYNPPAQYAPKQKRNLPPEQRYTRDVPQGGRQYEFQYGYDRPNDNGISIQGAHDRAQRASDAAYTSGTQGWQPPLPSEPVPASAFYPPPPTNDANRGGRGGRGRRSRGGGGGRGGSSFSAPTPVLGRGGGRRRR